MKNIDEHIDLIERYLYDDLTQEELEEFNDLLRQDTEFNKLFYEMDHLLDGIRRSAKKTTVEEKLARLEEALPFKSNQVVEQESTNTIKRIIDSINFHVDQFIAKLFNLNREEINVVPIDSRGQTSTFTILGRIKLIAASSIVMIFLAATIIYTQFSSLSLSELYVASYQKPELEVINVRSSESNEKGNFIPIEIQNQANIEFNNSNYGTAIEITEKIPDSEKIPAIKYCAALSYMETNEFNKAIVLWQQLEKVDDIVWQERSKWFLALCYLHDEDKNQAIKYLEEVSLIGGEFSENAKKLIKKVH